MKKTKRFISFLLVIQMMFMCTIIPGVAAKDAMEESLIVNENTEELVPGMATRCGTTNDPLVDYFGANYTVTSTSGPWQYISGAGGITGAYNTSTGYGYVQMSDGSKSPFQI